MNRRSFLGALIAAPAAAVAVVRAAPYRDLALTANVWGPGGGPLTEEMMRKALAAMSYRVSDIYYGYGEPRTTSAVNALKLLMEEERPRVRLRSMAWFREHYP